MVTIMNNVMDISSIVDNDHISDTDKRARLIGTLRLEYPCDCTTDKDLQDILIHLKDFHYPLLLIVEELRFWCAERGMRLYSVKETIIYDDRV
jgi:hypothetical protein